MQVHRSKHLQVPKIKSTCSKVSLVSPAAQARDSLGSKRQNVAFVLVSCPSEVPAGAQQGWHRVLGCHCKWVTAEKAAAAQEVGKEKGTGGVWKMGYASRSNGNSNQL